MSFGNFTDNPSLGLASLRLGVPPLNGILYQNGVDPINAVAPPSTNLSVLRYNNSVTDNYEWVLLTGTGAVDSVNGQTGNVVLNLNDINDVVAPSPNVNDVIIWNGTQWVSGNSTIEYTVNTTNNVPTPLVTLATATNTSYRVTAEVLAVRTGGAGSPGETSSYSISANVKNVGGTLTVRSDILTSTEDFIAASINVDTSGTNIVVNVIGIVGYNLAWRGTIKVISQAF
jgi:hypothetical protein